MWHKLKLRFWLYLPDNWSKFLLGSELTVYGIVFYTFLPFSSDFMSVSLSLFNSCVAILVSYWRDCMRTVAILNRTFQKSLRIISLNCREKSSWKLDLNTTEFRDSFGEIGFFPVLTSI